MALLKAGYLPGEMTENERNSSLTGFLTGEENSYKINKLGNITRLRRFPPRGETLRLLYREGETP